MIVHEIKTKKHKIFNVRFFKNIIYSKNRNTFFGELPNFLMQYLDTACENKYIFTCSITLEVKSNN